MEYKVATLDDIEATLKLHAKYQIDSINKEDKKDGFVTTSFTKEELTQLIEQEQGLFIAKEGEEVLAYVMSASWEFWSKWAMFAYMIEELPKLEYKGMKLSTDNSYQYGPICIDKLVRGTEVLPKIFNFALKQMSKRYPILITFVNQINTRSYEAHHRKLGLDVICEFEFNGNRYWEMGCLTST
ncbi:Protein export cytoplasm protein SecA ATPase RNA helicase (TC 3.A.5.1.1) [hydrothermal vent metagenome]|uniref:Protein export cytoplasm protein SecA ATPase RNA helicase (TC 3.A.5.1.1) n=1 Tax=hydrothermal vent metagenome TaxID=652676 RepID=A0A1W1CLY1_9ZZZZ